MLPYMVAVYDLVTACTAMLGWDENRTLRLLSGHSLASSEATVAMREVATTIRQSPAAIAALIDPDTGLLQELSKANRASGEAIATWIDTYGFRSTQYDWSTSWIAQEQWARVGSDLGAFGASPSGQFIERFALRCREGTYKTRSCFGLDLIVVEESGLVRRTLELHEEEERRDQLWND